MHAALKRHRGVMLDVGAHYGGSLAPFASDGWEVHAFEPDPSNRAHLEARFGGYRNVTIVPKAVSDQANELPLFSSDESSGVSSLVPFTAGHKPTASVEVITLRDYLAWANIKTVDFMKVDVEGFELNVLNGYDWAIIPNVILLEFEDFKSVPLGYSWKDLADGLIDRGYHVVVSEWFPIHRYGAAHRWRQFSTYPSELADPNAWGNLIAARTLEQLTRSIRRVTARYRLRQRVERVIERPVARTSSLSVSCASLAMARSRRAAPRSTR